MKINFLQPIGVTFLKFLESVGKIVSFALIATSYCFRPPYHFKVILRQFLDIGFYSLPVVGMTTLFAGMVLALQSYTGFGRAGAGAQTAIPIIVVISITRELGPVLAGLMIAGRVGASIAAEIGTMRVTEQIDALETLSTNPYRYLIVPRLIAATLMLPLLVLVGDVIGVFGGYLVSIYKLGFNPGVYLTSTLNILHFQDVFSGLVKAAIFGYLIALMGCYNGFNSQGGAQGVGAATTNAVVSSSILLLIANYVITQLFFSIS